MVTPGPLRTSSGHLESTNPWVKSTETIPTFPSTASSPLQRRRPRTASPPTTAVHSGSKVTFPRMGSSDKALPPLPDAAGPAPLLTRRLPETPRKNILRTLMTDSVFSASKAPTSTSAPAHEGMERGVVPTMSSALPLPTTANTTTNDTQPPTGNSTSPIIRKAKSSSKLKTKMTRDHESNIGASETDKDYRRLRGLSFGSSNFFNFAGDSKTKEKEKGTDVNKAPLSRRGSFWSRRRQPVPSPEPLPTSACPSSSNSPNPPPITTHKSLSPANLPGNHSQPLPRSLSRSLSERSFLSRSSPPVLESRHPHTSSRSPRTRSSPKTPHHASSIDSSNPSPKARYSRDSNRSKDASRLKSRPRAQTNPPLLHRLSLNLFSFATSPPSPNSKNNSVIDLTVIPSSSKARPTVVKSPRDDETPSAFVQRLVSSVRKGEIAGILASSAHAIYTKALQTYFERIDFVNDPLDIAMRKLLMHVDLPRETQQIDRVIEAFARRYLDCNPDLFLSEDHPYILAFSLMMLHTDAFNKSNKRKMIKGDYVKNARLPGVASEVLEYFYDNIVFAPFIFIEDPMENGVKSISSPEASSSRIFSPITSPSLASSGNSGNLLKSNKIDPYYLIVHNLLAPLRIDVHLFVPPENPYFYEGPAGPWDVDQLQRDFAASHVLMVDGLGQWQDIVDTTTHCHPEEIDTAECFAHTSTPLGTTCGLKIIKVGLLNMKEDISMGSKKATNRKWRPRTVILTASHLLFLRDVSLVKTLRPYLDSSHRRITIPHSVTLKPDHWLTIFDSIAIYDQSYTKYNNVFRFAMSDGRQMLLQASNDKEMNDWMAKINYASTFKTAQTRVRPLGMTERMVELTGMAAAASHLQDIQHRRQSTSLHDWDTHFPSASSDTLLGSPKPNLQAQPKTTLLRFEEAAVPIAPEVEGADQFKATFDQVKADLAVVWASPPAKLPGGETSVSESSPPLPQNGEAARLPSRFHATQSKVETLQKHIATTQTQLDVDMRTVNHIALLTPFQKMTRDRLESALHGIAERIAQLRINLVKLLCYHDTLCRDLSSEVRSWGEANRIAFQAAQQTLQRHYDELVLRSASSADRNKNLRRPRSRSASSSEHSSFSESFYSALDVGLDGPSFNEGPSSANGKQETWASTTSSVRLSSSDASHTHSVVDKPAQGGSEREEAEVWDKTRCAQRVSLVRLPSTLQMTRLGVHSE